MARKSPLSKREKWRIARPYLVEIVLMITEYIFNKDEEFKDKENRNSLDHD